MCVKILPRARRANSSGGKMQHLTKGKALIPFVIVISILSIFMFLTTTKNITRVSAVEASGVGVYWDSDCSNRTSSIDWGTLYPGLMKNIAIYVRNEEKETMYFGLSSKNWSPIEASEYLGLGWDYTERQVKPNETLRITLTLFVSRSVQGISSFSFNILIAGNSHLFGDVNDDGKVDVLDIKLVKMAYSGLVELPSADVNGDDRIDLLDVKLVRLIFSGII